MSGHPIEQINRQRWRARNTPIPTPQNENDHLTRIRSLSDLPVPSRSLSEAGGTAAIDPAQGEPVGGEAFSKLIEHRFEPQGAIGDGPLGRVISVGQRALGRTVALKYYRFPDQPSRDREAIAAAYRKALVSSARLSHPAIVPILDGDPEGQVPFLVSEFMAGGDLALRLACEQRLSPNAALEVLAQVLSALFYAHRQGVVHGGLQPRNVLFDSEGFVRISDFGYPRRWDRLVANGANAFIGTGPMGFVAPEIAQGQSAESPSGDMFAAGVLLYVMVTGRLPGRRAKAPSSLADGVPHVVDDLFERLAAQEPHGRFSSVADAMAAIRPHLRSGSGGGNAVPLTRLMGE